MKNNMNSELILENPEREENKMRIIPDYGSVDLVGFVFYYKGKLLSMCDKSPRNGNAEEYFHLDKFQVGCLIDYLKRIYDDMDN